MALQAREYEIRHGQNGTEPLSGLNLQQFFDSSIAMIENSEVQGWGDALEELRQRDNSPLS